MAWLWPSCIKTLADDSVSVLCWWNKQLKFWLWHLSCRGFDLFPAEYYGSWSESWDDDFRGQKKVRKPFVAGGFMMSRLGKVNTTHFSNYQIMMMKTSGQWREWPLLWYNIKWYHHREGAQEKSGTVSSHVEEWPPVDLQKKLIFSLLLTDFLGRKKWSFCIFLRPLGKGEGDRAKDALRDFREQ